MEGPYDSVLYVPEGSQWVVSIQKSTFACIGINVLYVIVLDSTDPHSHSVACH